MCGISGILKDVGDFKTIGYIQEMTSALRHRGPDDEGFAFFFDDQNNRKVWQFGGDDTAQGVYRANLKYTPKEPLPKQIPGDIILALGHRRLAILDLSPAGHQPMCTEDQRYWIVYNGEIYNYVELREELIHLGYSFQSQSDTEVLLNSYAQWGISALNKFVGMFAFAIYDQKKNNLFLARDFFGIKPLYYSIWPGGFSFASEIKALLCIPSVTSDVNPQRVYEYLHYGITDVRQDTFFQNIQQLPAAHYMQIDIGSLEIPKPIRYWNLNLIKKSELRFNDAAKKIRELFLDNVRLHMRSDVTVGAALSGGIDSSSIVMAMRNLQGEDLNLHTFSYIAENSKVNEEKWINIIAELSKAKAFKVKPSAEELLADIDQLIYTQDEPFGSTSIYAQYRVMRLSNENGIKVMLDGQGADEMLAGYPPYFSARFASLVRQLKWLKAYQFLQCVIQNPDCQSLKMIGHAGNYFAPAFLRTYVANKKFKYLTKPWLNELWFKKHNVKRIIESKSYGQEILREELYQSLTSRWLTSLLRYEDRNSMAFSIESRVPFLTPDLVEFVISLPEEYIIDIDGKSKAVFRQAMKGIVPDAILNRKDKIGFATPEKKWFLHTRNWIESVLNSDQAKEIPALNIPALLKTWENSLINPKKLDFTVWRWINFIRWSEQYSISFK